ncbi:MAG TPA: serine/threonine-protein kinase [Bryobacteraceae bacterium]
MSSDEGDDRLRREVESLLTQTVSTGMMLEHPAFRSDSSPKSPSARLAPGAQLGPYRIEDPLGAGGMGEVFRAVDTRLGRKVAIKVVKAEFSSHFHREARAISALNHPNICTLYDVGHNYLVMELIPGQTLAERLKAGAVPLEESLRICIQMADALGAAHLQGITHGDIKPANIKVTSEGRVKVLDFGLAKAAPGPWCEVDLPTLTAITQSGVIAGTPAYMSPEQMRSGSIDKRTDIWAFGCVLYEMLAGRRCFPGRSTAEIIAAVLKAEPDWQFLSPGIPPIVRQLLQHCLEKEPHQRLPEIADARKSLEQALLVPSTVIPGAPHRTIGSLAVLPFANSSGDPQMEYLSDGLTENIILNLSQLPQLRVMSRSAVFRSARVKHFETPGMGI